MQASQRTVEVVLMRSYARLGSLYFPQAVVRGIPQLQVNTPTKVELRVRRWSSPDVIERGTGTLSGGPKGRIATGLTRLWRALGVGDEELRLRLEVLGVEGGAIVLQISNPSWDSPVAPVVESHDRPFAPMRPLRIEAESVLGFSRLAVGFDSRLVVLLGPNSSGKTSFLSIFSFLQMAALDAAGSEIGQQIALLRPIRKATPRFGRIALELRPVESDGPGDPAEARILRYEVHLDYQTNRLAGESLVEQWGSGDTRTLVGKAEQYGNCSLLDETTGMMADVGTAGSVLALQDHTLERQPTVMQIGQFVRGIRSFLFEPDQVSAPAVTTVGAKLAGSGGGLVAVLENLRNRDPARFQDMTERLREVAPYIRDVTFEPAGKAAREVVIRTFGGASYPLSVESAGVQRTLAFLGLRFGLTRPTCVLADEIENGLHPDALLRNLDCLRTMSEEPPSSDPHGTGAFVVLATHSPVVVGAFHDRRQSVLLASRDAESDQLQVVAMPQAHLVLPREALDDLLQQFGLRDLWLAGALEPTGPPETPSDRPDPAS